MSSRLLRHLSVDSLTGVGASLAAKFKKRGITTLQDLLLYLPYRYENRTIISPIADLIPGSTIAIEGTIVQKKVIIGRRNMLVCSVTDGTGIIELRFLNVNIKLKNSLSEGAVIKAYGEIRQGRQGVEIIHPKLNLKKTTDDQDKTLTAVYYTTHGLTQAIIRKAIKQALQFLKQNPPRELIPANKGGHLPDIVTALTIIHEPPLSIDIDQLTQMKHPAQLRLIIEELLAYQLSMQLHKNFVNEKQAYPLRYHGDNIQQFIVQLPFTLTTSQQCAISDVSANLQQSKPMMRLIQGDVGSGKTIVAAIAALQVLSDNKQVVLIAPTEILAEQHFYNFKQWFSGFNIKIECVTAAVQGKAKKNQLHNIATGYSQLIIGTHAVFYDQIKFNKLALIIIDEQHRFGVGQRLALWQKGVTKNYYPHQLIMTATPIPRTLAMTMYADLEISTIDELPAGRVPVKTVVIPNTKRSEIIRKIKTACEKGRQAYWVCTLIEESDQLEAQTAEQLTSLLQHQISPLQVGLIHSRIKTEVKKTIMENFKQGHIHILVATTVIEVGVDIPNASLIIIENAERLGLAQLHQLRGRVGRSRTTSYCILLYQAPLSKIAKARLAVMRKSTDGFIIAQQDMKIRGIGEILGTKQTGSTDFKIVDLIRDHTLITEVQPLSHQIMASNPEQAQQLIDCWIADKQQYINA